MKPCGSKLGAARPLEVLSRHRGVCEVRLPGAQGVVVKLDEEDLDRPEIVDGWWRVVVMVSGRRTAQAGRAMILHRFVVGAVAKRDVVRPIDGDYLNCTKANLRKLSINDSHAFHDAPRSNYRATVPAGIEPHRKAQPAAFWEFTKTLACGRVRVYRRNAKTRKMICAYWQGEVPPTV